MKEQQNHFEAFELAQCASKHNQKILYLCSSDKEARLVKHELELYLPAEEIAYYPEREILPYDRFSTSQSIIQSRIGLLNSSKENLKVIITSGLNLLEKLLPKSFLQLARFFTLEKNYPSRSLPII